LTGAPASDYLCSAYTSEKIWSLISDAYKNGFIIGCGTPGSSDKTNNAIGLS
jgi:hypothetical protein